MKSEWYCCETTLNKKIIFNIKQINSIMQIESKVLEIKTTDGNHYLIHGNIIDFLNKIKEMES